MFNISCCNIFFVLTVPASFLEHVTNQTVLIGNKASILCNALGANPIKIRWLRNHKFIGRTPSRMKVYNMYIWHLNIISLIDNWSILSTTNSFHFQVHEETTHNGLTSSMIIRKTRRDDSALFQCLATNKFGNSQKTIKLIVQVIIQRRDNP